MEAAQERDAIWVIAVGDAMTLPTELVSALRNDGWCWDAFDDIDSFLAASRHRQMVALVVIEIFTIASLDIIHNLAMVLSLPVVVLSLEHHPMIVRAVLDAGAEDFIALPTTIDEVLARLHAIIRVRFAGDGSENGQSIYELNEAARQVSISGGAAIPLSLVEYRLFKALLSSANQPVPREHLRALLAPFSRTPRSSTLEVTVSRLRRKLGATRLLTIRGIGYQLIDSGDAGREGLSTV